MRIFVIISEYGDCREICFQIISRQLVTAQLLSMFDTYICQDELRPIQAEVYLFEGDLHFALDLCDAGVKLEAVPPPLTDPDAGDLYEAVTLVPFQALRRIVGRYAKPVYLFSNQYLSSGFVERSLQHLRELRP